MAYTHSPKEPIAIIGVGCRFPGDATSPSKLWDLLRSPRDLTKPIPSESRFNAEGFYHPNGEHHGASNVTKSYFIEEDPRFFDAGFFSIAPREAEAIDPQQRLLLETVYEAMESAGLTLHGLRGSQTSAYTGAMSADYTDTQMRDLENLSQYMITGTSRALLSNRLSYFFDWKGPSISVDTACSSSLAAVHLGVQSLRNGECTLSCVAGSNLILGPDAYLAATSLHLLSPSGRSQMWDQAADGYARGEGICAFFMKTLSQALRDGDRIDALIRESCINSDGRTKGITLPSAEAQAALIRTTYRNAGLDILRAEDRPQYVEAHGTGTQAGDPREASAISQTFFPPGHKHDDKPSLVVGSVKTIIGHTEGCAGIAGLLKVLLAMRHKTIPPNQHLHNLNPSVKPSYSKLQIPTTPQDWPSVPPNHPLRASVNGFGSGGTNCHAIMETYVPEVHDVGPWGIPQTRREIQTLIPPNVDFTPTPLIFSAASESALVAMLEKYAQYLEKTDVPIQRLAKTLNSHRSTLPVRKAFPTTSKQDLLEAIKKELSKVRGNPGTEIGTRSSAIEFDNNRRPRILGVFTGQGAQWPGMGQSLIERCALFRETIELMEQSLAQLPDPPEWSLKKEIMAPPAQSRLGEAELSLPICAAVQVGLVSLLSEAGITFHTVVGHSGGEIGAAYAAGKISATDAVKIAYYRGVYAKLAIGADGKKGAMIAVGFGYDEGLSFCSTAKMQGRLTIAASNSPKSVTLSGDEDAVIEAKQMLDDEGLFNRVLKLDTAYHSSHMYPCAEPYLAALERCGVQVGESNGTTAWVSSVYEDNRTITPDQDTDMQALYWKDNLIGRVLFSQALERALDDGRGALDLVLEVGPHPALRGPSLETIRTKLGAEIPYSGVLDRKADDVTALSTALGFVWTHLGSSCVDFRGYSSAYDERHIDEKPLPDLPTYPWDHKKILWRESRLNRQVRHRADRPHELLGNRTPDDTDYEPRWRNYFKLEEMPWLRDHCIQNQIIVPAATYCVMALEAARFLGRGKHVKSIELRNVAILRPIVLDESSGGTETLFSLRSDLDSSKGKGDIIQADFSLSSGTMEDGHMRTAATGEIHVHLTSDESDSSTSFPSRPRKPQSELLPVNVNQFYESLGEMGLNYSGPFRAMTSVERRMDMASAVVAIDENVGRSIPVHPTWLDVCFQTFLAAFAAPRDDSLWTAFLPTTIGRMTFSPTPSVAPNEQTSMTVDAHLTEFTPGFQATLPTIAGDMSIYNSKTGQLEVFIEDFTMSSFLPATEKDDRLLYLKTVWRQDILSGATFETTPKVTSLHELKAIDACEKAIHYYLSKLRADKSFHEIAEKLPGVIGLVEEVAARVASEPTQSELVSIFEEFGGQVDMVLVRTIGEQLFKDSKGPASVSDEAPASMSELVSRWHSEGLGFAQVHKHIVSAAKQIAHRHTNLRILQVGPSAASLVRTVCQELEHSMDSYTIVDGSAQAVGDIKESLTADQLRVDVRVFDVENGTADVNDAVAAGSFDLVIVHKAFTKQKTALNTIRTLMRPGGFLLMMAATGDQLRFPFFLLSAPPPVNEADGSIQAKLTNSTREETHKALCDAGFSGVDSMALDNVPEKHTFSVVVSQALDDQIGFLRAPFASTSSIVTGGKLLVLGGSSVKVANAIKSIQANVSRVWDGEVIAVECLADLTSEDTESVETVLSLTELDHPVLEQLSALTFKNLQRLLEMSKTVLWVTQGAGSESPYQSGTIGLGRTFLSENPQKVLQFLDLDTLDGSELLIAESLLRLVGGATMRDNSPSKTHLWSIEPELTVKQGKLLIPRLLPDGERNNRLNALKRKVETQILVGKQPVTLTRSGSNASGVSYMAVQALQPRSTKSELFTKEQRISLRVEYCSVDPVIPKYHGKELFCCIGRTEEGIRFLALSDSNSSIVAVPREWTVAFDGEELQNANPLALFTCVLSEIKSRIIEASMPSKCTTLLYEADADLSAAIEKRKSLLDKDFAFISYQAQSTGEDLPSNHIEIGPHTSRKDLTSMIPPRTRLLIHLGRHFDARKLSVIQQVLPRNAGVVSFSDLDADDLVPQEILAEALASAKYSSSSLEETFDSACVVKASALVTEGVRRQANVAVVDWAGDQMVTVTQRPVDPGHLFSGDKTYLLMGLSGQIGQSMCRWMVRNGARHIVVTSRHPDKEARWKDELQRHGANIAIEAVDVTNKQDLVDLRARVLGTMPPIGGVANGAMVLSDKLFADMPYESFQRVLSPKVDGSKNLDEVFSGDDLEFFLLFSSISAVTGQRSQANYAAANNFMVGLASQRRARNLPASVIDIGMVIGIGVIQRTEDDDGISVMETALRKLDYMPVSERDLQHLLAEAILVGTSDDSPEIVTGLETYNTASSNRPFWHNNPRFSHLMNNAGSSKTIQDSGSGVQKTLKEKLADARGPEDALQTMEEALLGYLASSLKLSLENMFTDVPIIDLGIDSLVAVEIRNWIFSEAGHDVPVLKILGGSSINQICTEVISSLSFEGKQAEASDAHARAAPLPESRDWNKAPTEPNAPEDASTSSGSSGMSPRPDSLEGSQPTSAPATEGGLDVVDTMSSRPTPIRTEPLSLGQSRLYFLSQYLDDDTVLNCTASYALSGKLDVSKLEKSLEAVTQRHETLRTIYYTNEEDGQPVQGILEKSTFRLNVAHGISDTTRIKAEFDRTHAYQYSLETGDTFIATVLSHSADSHTIIFGYHHIVMDGVSWQIFQQDLAKFYNDPNAMSALQKLPTQYAEFTLKQQRDLANGAYAERLKFFQDEFREPIDPLPLFPFAKVSTRKSLKQYAVRDVITHVSADVVSALKKASQASRTTSFHFFLSAFQVLLNKLVGIEQMCIGMVDANRSDQNFSNTIGFFLETIPVLFRVHGEQKFSDILQITRTKAYAALAQTGIPTEEILRSCNVPASTTETPLFQVIFNYRMGASRTAPMQGVDMKFLEYADAKNPFDLVVSVDELDDGTAMLTFSLQDYLYDQEGAQLLANTYTHLLDIFSKDTARSVGSVPIFDTSLAEQAIALGTGRKAELAPSSDGTLSKIFNAWVEKDPGALAVKDVNGNSKTYLQLSERAGAISAELLSEGTAPPSSVCVLLDPQVDTIAAILGVLRVGSAYVPLDIRSTDERLSDILHESGATVLLYHAATSERAQKLARNTDQIKLVNLDSVPQTSAERIEDLSALDGLAMILYTSGSTGKPKGIPLTNGNIRAPILGVTDTVGLRREVVLQQSGQGFDAAIYQIFIALANGGSLVMGDNRGDPTELAALMAREAVTCSVFIVSEMQSILKYGYKELRECSSWRIAMVAGEAFTTNLLDQFRSLNRSDLRIINAYGPTEASICSSMHEVSPSIVSTGDFSIPIGKAIANYGTYIVDENSKPVPIGWPGEIAISGPGVTSGYLDLPQLTESKFKPATFVKEDPEWDRLYLTGDKGRMLSDGSIVMSGRVDGDDQVKIRGMRVQLDDVSRVLVQASRGTLVDAAVLVRGEDSTNQRIVAYVVFSRASQVDDKQTYLRQLIQELPIPLYMRPVIITPLDILPVTERGKLDNRKLASLPLPDVSLDDETEDDLTEEEARLREVWRSVLGDISSSVHIRRNSDFFSVGGNSLLLLRLKSEIRRVFGVEIPLAELFQTSTLELLAARLTGHSKLIHIDWEKETELDDNVFGSPHSTDTPKPSAHGKDGLSVLLTGATGFLGHAILRQLVQLPQVARVHCAAIRESAQGEPRSLGVDSPKIVRHSGDLALPNLGLSKAQAVDLFDDVDVIIHNGAEVSHMKNYRSLRASNVLSTIELARLALRRSIPIHYISTGGIARLSGAAVQLESSLAEFYPPVNGSDGYVASKWASEVILEKFHKRFQGQIWIHRPSSITGDNVPALDIVHSVLKFSKLMKAVPDLAGSTGAFDFVHVDTVSKDIASSVVRGADRATGGSSDGLTYVHQSGDEIVPVDQLKAYLEGSAAGSFGILPFSEWVARAIEAGLDEVVGSFLLASKGMIRVPLLQKSRRNE